MFAGNLTENATNNTFAGTLVSRNFDIGIKLVAITPTSAKAPNFEVIARNTSGRNIKIGSAWDQKSGAGNRYISMQIDVGDGPFRVNAVQTETARGSEAFDIIPFVGNQAIKSGSVSGELTAMDADNAFTGYVANMSLDLDFTLIENAYKTEEKHPDYHIVMSSPKGVEIRIGAAWMAQGQNSGNDYISLLINTPDGDLRVNAVQNEEQRGGNTFSIIPFVEAAQGGVSGGNGMSLVA